MDFEPYDSSGTDDDLPPSHQNRMPRGNRISGNGRPTSVGAMPAYPPRMYGENDMESQIHQLEKEAYCSVLRAFKAQADAITWEKEGLITELRKELRLSNEEHKELLAMVDKDDVTRRIREWRQKGGGHQTSIRGASHAVHDPVPSPSVSAHRKNKKMGGSLPSQSFSGPTPFHTQAMVPPNQPSSSAAKRGPMLGPKGKKYKSGQMLPAPPSANMQYPPTGPTGRNQFSNQVRSGGVATESTEAGPFNLIGRKVRTRWPDDNNFYEAYISDYNHNEGRHALVYDSGTVNETWEWVNLSEIAPEDIQWDGEEPGISHHGSYGPGNGLSRPRGPGPGPGPGPGRGRMMPKGHPRKEFPATQNGVGKKGSDYIRLLQTDTLIKEVERIFSISNPDPQEAEKAKKALKEHEQALVDAIGRLAEISDGESDGEGHFMHGQTMEVE